MKLTTIIIFLFMFVGINSSQAHTTKEPGIIQAAFDNVQLNLVFSNHDRDVVHRYYAEKRKYKDKRQRHGFTKKAPPGLAKRNHLPPGLQKHIRKNGKLPPGLQGRHLPHRLERYLDPLPENYARLRVGNDIVLLNLLTETILDVIWDVAF